MTDAQEWRERRREAAGAHADALAQRQAAESRRASAMLADLARTARADGPPPVPLQAQSYDGRHAFRTGLEGWYLRRDRSVGVDTEGRFYVLRVPGGLRSRLTGVRLEPQAPPLVLGAGGKDGESLDLEVAIARVLGTA